MTYEITNSVMALAILHLCETVPRLMLSMFGGAMVDRYDRLRLLITIQFLSAAPFLFWLSSTFPNSYGFGICLLWFFSGLDSEAEIPLPLSHFSGR